MTNQIDATKKSINEGVLSVMLHLNDGTVLLDTKDISECYFIEDIFSYTLTGKITFTDMYGITEYGPLTGNEIIRIAYGVQEDKEIIFSIWKMGKVTQGTIMNPTSQQELEILFVDALFEPFTMQRFSRSWVDTNVTDITKHIMRKMVGISNDDLHIEESDTKIDFIMPYWTPMQSIGHLLKRARSKEYGKSGYVCYANTKPLDPTSSQSYNIKTFNNLFDKENTYLDKDVYTFQDSGLTTSNKIFEWWINGLDRFGVKYLRGGHWRGFDFMRKQFLDEEYQYETGVKETMMLGQKSLFTDISTTTTVNSILGQNNEEIMQNLLYDGWSRRYNMQHVLNIIVRGHEARYAGSHIEIVWPSADEQTGSINKQWKGKYLVKSVTHYLVGGNDANMSYRQRLVLLKNAVEESDMSDLVPSTLRNLYSGKTGTVGS